MAVDEFFGLVLCAKDGGGDKMDLDQFEDLKKRVEEIRNKKKDV